MRSPRGGGGPSLGDRPPGGGGGPSLGKRPPGGGGGPSSLGWGTTRVGGGGVVMQKRWVMLFEMSDVFHGGVQIRRCPIWIAPQQVAELWGIIGPLDVARQRHCSHVQLIQDNMGGMAQILWGRAGAHFVQQQRTLRRLLHRLRWQGVSVRLW